ncbi:MAG: hypothetical protein ACRCUS_01485 [Anaerovoracaceae bacterium]
MKNNDSWQPWEPEQKTESSHETILEDDIERVENGNLAEPEDSAEPFSQDWQIDEKAEAEFRKKLEKKKKIRSLIALIVGIILGFVAAGILLDDLSIFSDFDYETSSAEPVIKAEESKITTEEEFEGKYGFDVKASVPVSEKKWQMMDATLSAYGSKFIKELTKQYTKYDEKFLLKIKKPSKKTVEEESLGYTSYNPDKSLIIEIFVDDARQGYTGGFDAPTIAHEFGHATHYAIEFAADKNEKKMKKEWKELNYGQKYNGDFDKEAKTVFIDDYGSSNYYEDVAASFEYLATKRKMLKKRLTKPEYYAIYQKMNLLREYTKKGLPKAPDTIFSVLDEIEIQD